MEWNVDRAGKVPKCEFVLRPDVENHDAAAAHAFHQLLARDRLQRVAGVEIVPHHARNLGDVAFRDPAQGGKEIEHGVIRELVEDELSVAAASDETSAPHLLQMLRSIGDGKPGALRQQFDASLPLRQLLQEFEPMRMRERLGDGGELREQGKLRTGT